MPPYCLREGKIGGTGKKGKVCSAWSDGYYASSLGLICAWATFTRWLIYLVPFLAFWLWHFVTFFLSSDECNRRNEANLLDIFGRRTRN